MWAGMVMHDGGEKGGGQGVCVCVCVHLTMTLTLTCLTVSKTHLPLCCSPGVSTKSVYQTTGHESSDPCS